MMRKIRRGLVWFLIAFFFEGMAAQAAEITFYGVKMKSESIAQDLFDQNIQADFKTIPDREGIDKRIYAKADVESGLMTGKILNIRIFNRSDKPIAADYRLTDYTIVTKDGERYEFDENSLVWHPYTEVIDVGKTANFKPSLGQVDVKKQDIKMIICSFNFGETKIILLPTTVKRKLRLQNENPLDFLSPAKPSEKPVEVVQKAPPSQSPELIVGRKHQARRLNIKGKNPSFYGVDLGNEDRPKAVFYRKTDVKKIMPVNSVSQKPVETVPTVSPVVPVAPIVAVAPVVSPPVSATKTERTKTAPLPIEAVLEPQALSPGENITGNSQTSNDESAAPASDVVKVTDPKAAEQTPQ